MSLKIIKNDITKISCDAIVNAANKSLLGGGGVDGAIHKAAGIGLFFDCLKLRGCKVGDAKITPAHKLPCEYVIHTVGPKWQDGTHGEAELLADCYWNSLALAKKHECESIAFPLISTGVYKFPKAEALKIAVDTISKFLENNDMEVIIVVYEKSDFQLDADLKKDITNYINQHYEADNTSKDSDDDFQDFYDWFLKRRTEFPWLTHSLGYRPSKRGRKVLARRKRNFKQKNKGFSNHTFPYGREKRDTIDSSVWHPTNDKLGETAELPKISDGCGQVRDKSRLSLEERLKNLDDSFMTTLFKKIDEKGIKDSECYIKANMDKKKFYKIKNGKNRISKQTALAFAVALELNLDQTIDFIGKAGYSLTHSSEFDIIVEYHIDKELYNIHEINIVLFEHDQVLLG